MNSLSDNTAPRTPRTTASSTRTSSARQMKAAHSAKILVTGLATTAMFGMSAGYAYAQHQHDDQSPTNTVPLPVSMVSESATAPTGTTGSNGSSSAAQTGQNRVVNVPIPQAAPATSAAPSSGGSYASPPPTQQQSSGSR